MAPLSSPLAVLPWCASADSPRNILVLQLKRIGDLILTAAATAALRRAWPDARITLVSMGAAGELAPLLPGVDETLLYRHRHANLSLWRRLTGLRPDLCLDFCGTQRAALMVALSRAHWIAGYARLLNERFRGTFYNQRIEASVRDLHTVDLHLALVAPFAAIDPPPEAPLAIPTQIHESVDQLLSHHRINSGFTIIHPGTARAEKYWLPEHWAVIIDSLADQGHPIILTGGNDPAETLHLEQILKHCRHSPINFAGQLSLPQLAAIMERCTLALGVDTAAMHLAASFGTPQVVLFGPTNPYHWRPRHSLARIVLAGSPVSPCTEFNPFHNSSPMASISTDDVLHAIHSLR